MADNSKEPWDLVIGQVTAPFGIHGALRVRPETDRPERFHDLEEVCLELPSGEERIYRIRSARLSPKGVTLTLAGCEDRNSAAALRRAWIKIKRSMAIPLAEGRYWMHDVIGLRVVTEEGEDLGEVTEIIRAPGNDVYVTPSAMIPAVREVVREIDLEHRRMIVAPLAEEEVEAEAGEP